MSEHEIEGFWAARPCDVMDDREKSDGRALPVKLSNNAQDRAAEAVEKGDQPRGTRPAKRAPT
jgi:hypothetical protein